ncbi:MAG: [FeFe] hydrogenase H-cluster maturation GTPase HydF [Firmicutes bacterium]|nr:[FeFe] hydrogenase H-cluster maturation GTPase HydF [Bacillota bacterium]
MSLNATPAGERLHISIFGRRNAGKSSLINALTGQYVAIVSDVPGTTTDPVAKAMELHPLGPVTIVDTAGLDDAGDLGRLRVEKTLSVLNRTDLALLVIDPAGDIGEYERTVLAKVREQGAAVLAVVNKVDAYPQAEGRDWTAELGVPAVVVSALNGQGIDELKLKVVQTAPRDWTLPTIVGDLIGAGDVVILVIPIDKAAPKGRLILPQQQVIRDVLEHDSVAVMVKERELRHVIDNVRLQPRLVVCDSSAFLKAVADTPPDVLFTSFSILFARYKGDLNTLVAGAKVVKDLRPGDRVLIAEACTHHAVEDDIGRVKIPRWLRQVAGGELRFDVVSGGGGLPQNLRDYRLIVHCGACMLNRREMLYRLLQARNAGVPIVNYGILMAHMHGVLCRALSPFPAALAILGDAEEDLWRSP